MDEQHREADDAPAAHHDDVVPITRAATHRAAAEAMSESHLDVDAERLGGWRGVVRPLGSASITVGLLSLLAAALAVGAVLGARRGGEFAHWYVYDSVWFIGLLALVGMNALCGVLVRMPWRMTDAPFVTARIGLVVLLFGALQSYRGGVEGQIAIVEGESTGAILLPNRLQLTAEWPDRETEAPYEFLFSPGPADWSADRSLELGQIDGMRATVVHFLRHSAAREAWRDLGRPGGAPLVRLKVVGPQEKLIAEPQLADDGFGDEVLVGPIRIQLSRAVNDAMVKDFEAGDLPPNAEAAPQGELVVYYGDTSSRFNVRDSLGQKLPLGNSGAAVEIVECLVNAKPDSHGRFKSQGETPRNPLLELLVHLPERSEPLRQIALAKNPLLTLDQVRGEACPIKFRYLHPGVTPSPAVEFLHGQDGRLLGRCVVEGKYQSVGSLDVGGQVPLPGGFEVAIVERMESARREILFDAVPPAPDASHPPGPAAEFEIAVNGQRHRVWLGRTESTLHYTQIETPDGPLRVSMTPARRPLGFTLQMPDAKTLEIRHDSSVRRQPLERNKPIKHREFTLVAKSVTDGGHGKQLAVLQLVGDPGRPMQFVGGGLLCAGIAMSFVWPWLVRRRATPSPLPAAPSVQATNDPTADDHLRAA